jgi:hypothetical protein
MPENQPSNAPKRYRGVGLPPPDSRAGLALLGAIFLGIVYVLVFAGAYSAFTAEATWVVGLTVVISVVVTFFLVSMIGSDRARASDFELEFARTVQAHLAAGETLTQASPLGGILSEYARAAHDERNSAREHAYAASPAVYSTALALVAAFLVGLAYAIGVDPNTLGLAMLFEFFAFSLLVLTTGILVFSVGRTSEVPEFDAFVLRRWSRVASPSFPYTHSVGEVPWAAQAPLPVNPPIWQETGAITRPPVSTTEVNSS